MLDDSMTFSTLSKIGVKLILYPELKSKIEANFLCRQCVYNGLEDHECAVTVKESTYGLATIVTFTCNQHHQVQIIPETIDAATTKHSTKNFLINYQYLFAMQMMGKGLKSMTTLTGMLGLHVSCGNYKNWKWMQLHLGQLQQTLTKKL